VIARAWRVARQWRDHRADLRGRLLHRRCPIAHAACGESADRIMNRCVHGKTHMVGDRSATAWRHMDLVASSSAKLPERTINHEVDEF
jgi:hypothetical protein